ncbi:MAG: acetyl-CoA C-acetyltransferase [Rickettsiales bacterium]|nr:acetyl-CoA C-acetyltransferase [Rickettsiales bacterium]
MENVYIVDCLRTPIGSFMGSLSSKDAHELTSTLIHTLFNKNHNVNKNDVQEVILGEILTAGHGQNTARQAVINAGLSYSVPAFLINQVCGSGLRAVSLASNFISSGSHDLMIAGGQESMSRAYHAAYLRSGTRMGDIKMVDTMISDGLTDVFNNYHMGITAENLAEKYKISREEQDEFACNSQKKAVRAQQNGEFVDEIVPIQVKSKKDIITVSGDEFIRADATLEKLSKLSPSFKKDGTVTAGNASGLNDGAAIVLLASESYVRKNKITPMARVVSHASTGCDPALMGIGPVGAVRAALAKAKWGIDDLDVIEANEAFAAQAIAVNKELKWNVDVVNTKGGAIALGHPIGASGARILVTLVHQLKHKSKKKGLATLCIGGGMGVAVCIEAI